MAEINTHGLVDKCSVCSKLELSADQFVVGKPHSRYVPAGVFGARNLFRSGIEPVELGSWGRIRQAAESCKFCQLVSCAFEDSKPMDGDDNHSICIKWELDGHTGKDTIIGQSFVNRTRRLGLSWKDSLATVYLVFVAPDNQVRANSDAKAVRQHEASFLGRNIEASQRRQALIKSWIDICDRQHGGPCKKEFYTPEDFNNMASQTYFGVIDVADMQFKRLPPSRSPLKVTRFVALSYTWGKPANGEPYKTKKDNVAIHLQHGGLELAWEKFPRTIQDAIKLVQALNERYLWVDSLCIVQDSFRSWKSNAKSMHLIYGNAYFTICAADGSDSRAGLVAMSPATYSRQTREECAPGVTLMVSRPAEVVIKKSAWNSRGWTFQERILSGKCLIFAEGRIYFQCRSTGMSEDLHAEGSGTGWSLDSLQAPLRNLQQLESRAASFYTTCVELYTNRLFTNRTDILAAFEGMSALMQARMNAPFCFGLPTSHFDLALLWEPRHVVQRRVPRTLPDGNKENFGEDEFPSWSWCGWEGAPCEYNAKMLEGCFLDVHEWLVEHSWIQWYIRDGVGNLRPLWNRALNDEDLSTERRWRGYTGRNPAEYRNPSAEWAPAPGSPVIKEILDMHQDGLSQDGYLRFNSHERRDRIDAARGASITRLKESRSKNEARSDKLQTVSSKATSDGEIEEGESDSEDDDGGVVDNPANWGHPARRRRVPDPPSDFVPRSSPRSNPNHPSGPPRDHLAEEETDIYGRPTRLRPELEKLRKHNKFRGILPDNPFRVRHPLANPIPSTTVPDNPILQFWTYQASLHISKRLHSKSSLPAQLSLYDIADAYGDWCGSIKLDSGIFGEGQECDFVAISDAKSFTKMECPIWTYYVPKERGESEWDLFFVMLITQDRKKLVWERAGVGKVFQAAFVDSRWQEIKLG